ncbi:hypothetical protein [Sanguibacter gelidistatuariae]|nr:hypothetical protein [Sanguibacter gelidistatuariae]
MPGTTDDPDSRAGDSAEPVEPVELVHPADDIPAEPTDPPDLSDPVQTEAAWQQIVAELSDLSTNPDTERTSPTPATTPTFDFPVAPWVHEPAPVTSDPRAWRRSPEAEALEDADDTFVPPDPGPMLSTDRMRNLGWFAVVVAPLAAIVAAIFPAIVPSEVYLALSAGFLAGVGVLVWRLPSGPDDGPGSGGAVV